MLFALAIQRYLKANMLECYGHSDGGREEGGEESWRFGGRKKNILHHQGARINM